MCLDYSNLQERRSISKLRMIARGHWVLVYGHGSECALVFSTREKDGPTEIIIMLK